MLASSLAKLVSSGFSRRPCVKTHGEEQVRKTPSVNHTHTLAHACAHICTQTCREAHLPRRLRGRGGLQCCVDSAASQNQQCRAPIPLQGPALLWVIFSPRSLIHTPHKVLLSFYKGKGHSFHRSGMWLSDSCVFTAVCTVLAA